MRLPIDKLIDKLKGFVYGLSYILAILFTVAIILYIIESGFGADGEPVGFQLATISAVIGGLLLASAAVSSYYRASRMKRVGVFYLMAAVSFVVFGICFPILEWNCMMPWIAGIGMVAGALSFALATLLLAYTLPSIWSDTE